MFEPLWQRSSRDAGLDAESGDSAPDEQPAALAARRLPRTALAAVGLLAVLVCGGLASRSAAVGRASRSSRVQAVSAANHGKACNVQEAGGGVSVSEAEECSKESMKEFKEAMKKINKDMGGFDEHDHEFTVRYRVTHASGFLWPEDLGDWDTDKDRLLAMATALVDSANLVLGEQVSGKMRKSNSLAVNLDGQDVLVQVKYLGDGAEDTKKAWEACGAKDDARKHGLSQEEAEAVVRSSIHEELAAKIQEVSIPGDEHDLVKKLKEVEVSEVTCEKNPLGW